MRIEAAKQSVQDLPITPSVLASLRETARIFSTHYSTMIEGNRLTQDQVSAWVEVEFLVVVDPAKKSRKYGLGSEFSPNVR